VSSSRVSSMSCSRNSFCLRCLLPMDEGNLTNNVRWIFDHLFSFKADTIPFLHAKWRKREASRSHPTESSNRPAGATQCSEQRVAARGSWMAEQSCDWRMQDRHLLAP